MTRPARVIFNPAAVRGNLEVVKARAPGRRVLAIIKADGYGHGLIRVARALTDADAFGVASTEEAVRLREAGIAQSIVLLEGPFEASELAEIGVHRLESIVHNAEQVEWFARQDRATPLWIKIDTGMHRLGFAPADVPAVIERLGSRGRLLRLMTHFASAHLRGDASIAAQLDAFERLSAARDHETCLANSSAIMAWPSTHGDWVRPGLLLYGVSPFAESVGAELALQPAMTVTSALIAVKQVRAGGGVGYGKAYACSRDTPIGVVAFGYADGYPRHAATGTPVLVNGVRTQVLGDVSMDMMMVDLTPVPDARVGDPVVLWGEGLPVEEVAHCAGTIPYELLCRMRMRAHFVELQA